MTRTRWKVAAAVAGAALLGIGIAYVAMTLRVPAPLGLPSGSTTAPVISTADAMAATCRRPALPSGPGSSGGPSLWLIQPGSEVGYRVRERFVQLPAPHEAVARTGRVSGWVLASEGPAGIQLETGCIAVDIATLKSVDSIPGYDVAGRDQIYQTLFETAQHPYVVFQPYPILLSSVPEGQTAHVLLPGVLEMRGVAKTTRFSLDVRRSSDQVAAAGSAPVNVSEYGLDVPQGPAGFISIEPQATVELSVAFSRIG